MPVAALLSQLYVLDQYGPVEPTALAGPVRQGLVKYGDGLFVEEGTTNLVPVPNPGLSAATLALWNAGGYVATRDPLPSPAGNAVKLAGTGTQQFRFDGVTLVQGSAYTLSCWIYLTDGSAGAFNLQLITSGDTQTVATVAVGSQVTSNGRWVRLVATGTVTVSTGLANAYVRLFTDSPHTYYVAGFQLEQKAYATSYCDGSLATAWNAPGNLFPAPAQSFEDGTTGGYVVGSGTGALTNSVVFAYAGTRSLRANITATAAFSFTGATGTAGVPVTPGKLYSVTSEVRPSAARQIQVGIAWYTAAGAFISQAFGTAVTGTAGVFTKPVYGAVAPATAAYGTPAVFLSDATSGDTFDFDAFRFDEGTGATAYRWTGAENASPSTRTAIGLTFAIANNQPPQNNFTVVAIAKIPAAPTTAASGELVSVSGAGGQVDLSIGYGTAVNAARAYNGTTGSTASTGSGSAPGDLVLLAATWDGTTVTAYQSKNGGPVVSGTTALAGSATPVSAMSVGQATGLGGFFSGAVEQVLIFNGILTAAEIAALASSTNETAYRDDPRIVFALAAGPVRGTVQANTPAGTGRYRTSRTLLSNLEQITTTGANPDDDNATHKITVPAGSGVGQGQLVAFTPEGTLGTRFQVLRAFSPGGALDELLVVPA